jgi:site-specific DNA recombinase
MIALKGRAPAPIATKRVAIYTRQSVEDRTSEFGSIQAQREAVAAYITSQRSLAWEALPARYDDAGFSGGNVERPAFRQLLADIASGAVDVVAVYKIDRLSRSIGDFVQLMTLFDKHGVEFVSVTQQFSTTSSVGRLTLNLLITFAQFERETIAERTRDKMLAARRKGMWTGGPTPWGYALVEHRLVVDHEAAAHVRAAFATYLRTASVTQTIEFAQPRKRFDKDSMKRFLSSPVYVGMLRAGDEVVNGQHEAIIDRGTWDRVQALLRSPRRAVSRPVRATNDALLAGMLHCGACGSRMQPHYTARHGRRYSFYVCSTATKRGAAACPGGRVGLADIEKYVVEQVLTVCREPELVRATLEAARADVVNRRPLIERELAELEENRGGLVTERRTLAESIGKGTGRALIERLGVVEDEIAGQAQREQVLRTELAGLGGVKVDEEQLRTIGTTWDALFPAERNRLVRLLVQRVTFTPATRTIEVDLR